MIIIIMLVLVGLAYWRGDRPLFLISGLGLMIYGFSYIDTSLYYSILIVLAGIFTFIKAFTKRGMA